MYVRDKKQLNNAFSGTQKFSFYENKYTGKQDVVDYKDWIIGLGRRNNSIKFYFLFEHYGLENLRKLIYQTQHKADNLQSEILKDKDLFEVFCKQFGIVCFRVKCKNGRVNDQLTKRVTDRVKNVDEGFMSPGHFKDVWLLRIVIGNYHSDMKTIMTYYEKIK